MADETLTPDDKLEQLMKTNPWWKDVSHELDRVYMVHQLRNTVPAHHKSEAVSALFEYTLISDEDLASAQSHPVYSEAKAIIERLNAGDRFPARLIALYKSRIPDARHRVSRTASVLINLLSSHSLRAQVEQLWAHGGLLLASSDPDEVLKKLNVRTSNDRYIVRCAHELQALDRVLRHGARYPFGSAEYMPATVGEADHGETVVGLGPSPNRPQYLAYRVFDPLWSERLERFEPEYVTFPLKWAGAALDIRTLAHLYKQHKTGKDVVAALIGLYQDRTRLDRLENAIASCPVTKPYEGIFKEALDSFSDGRYRACSTAFLPIVEGILWEFAWWWNRHHRGLFDRAISRSAYKDSSQWKLLRKDGTHVAGRPNIGTLLRQTAFGELFNVEIVEYLVVELLDERNPVLHGRDPDYGSRRKASTLLFVLETLERTVTKWVMELMGKALLDSVAKSENAKSEDRSAGS